jgi:SAM-dependent methyltransferase
MSTRKRPFCNVQFNHGQPPPITSGQLGGLSTKMDFGFIDYWRMYKSRGVRLPLLYFWQCHLFDLRYKVDTHVWLPRKNHETIPSNFDRGTYYMPSWTTEIRNSFKVVKSLLKGDFSSYSFLDIGCGKGKVAIVWKQECIKASIAQDIFGVDYYPPFIDIARSNFDKMFGNQGNFTFGDGTQLDFASFGSSLIVYLSNPFDDVVLGIVAKRLLSVRCIVIYNNPVHRRTLIDLGYQVLYERNGGFPLSHTMIFGRPAGWELPNNSP